MAQDIDAEQAYTALRQRAAAEFGETRAAELEDFLRTTAQQIADVERAAADPDGEPLHQG